MNPRTHTRLVILHVLVITLMLVLVGRLWNLQVVNGEHYRQIASENRVRDIVVPAVRGQILDVYGRPLVHNRVALVVSVDRTTLMRQRDRGRAVLTRLAAVLGTTRTALEQKTRLCGPTVSRPCWPGSPFQPIPVEDKTDPKAALQIMERREDFPGVSAQLQSVRDYPRTEGAVAAQTLGYLQPLTQEELDRRTGLKVTGFSGVDLVGRDGLEAAYDADLRGRSGVRKVKVDAQGRVTGIAVEEPSVPGSHLVTSIDAKVQAAVERAIAGAVAEARKQGKKGSSAAGVVLDVQTGRVVALASLPTYDPAVWIGGISQQEYVRLLGKSQGEPLISRAIAGQFAPGSTFKISSLAAAVADGYPLNGIYPCPGSYSVGGRAFTNFRGVGHGMINLHKALVVSCDTIFYKFAYEQWLRDGGNNPGKAPKDPMVRTARKFGFGDQTGIDLPGESPGRIPDRAWKQAYWEATRKADCKAAKTGYPEIARTDPKRNDYMKKLAHENCVEGFKWHAAESVNLSVGQGNVLVTPLQLARAYAAVANGGKLVTPRLGLAVIRPDGTVVRRIEPPKPRKLDVDPKVLAYMRNALAKVPSEGTAGGAFGEFDLKKVAVAGKTGTAEVWGKDDTAWFASYAPADKPRFAIVAMVTEAGTGGAISAPAVRQIYEAIYGMKDGKPALPGGRLPDKLPKVRPDGTVDLSAAP
ncbi:penicillin-binding protein 2 [Actinomadura craniellae]|uniref:Penicillin-binding protein 2 n=1 Tax=Actinomadura craniellae TaxID=2231787 RepID=A0A365GV85_9ACTN|nr:penicillin-binding protein 2 [Actinomadura craniellae]RAY10709.1 penicillin-binding protein 2 [Actinomadura craniellae]